MMSSVSPSGLCPACKFAAPTVPEFTFHMATMHPGHPEAPAWMCATCHEGWKMEDHEAAMEHGRICHAPRRSIIVEYGDRFGRNTVEAVPRVRAAADPPGNEREWAIAHFEQHMAEVARALGVMPMGLHRTQAIVGCETAALFFRDGMGLNGSRDPLASLFPTPPATTYHAPEAALPRPAGAEKLEAWDATILQKGA